MLAAINAILLLYWVRIKILSTFRQNKKNYKLDIHIPAYTINKTGIVINLKLFASQSNSFNFISSGEIAQSLQKAFKRGIEILIVNKPEYEILKSFEYYLINEDKKYCVQDVRSAGMSICIALMNLFRVCVGKKPNELLIGTGVLRMDGSFVPSSYECIKKRTIFYNNSIQRLITSDQCNHIFVLESLLNHF